MRILLLGTGILTFFTGLFFLLTPAPGIITTSIGAALIAQESLLMARLLDGIEVLLRRHGGFSIDYWKRSPASIRLSITLLALTVSTLILVLMTRYWLQVISG